MNFNIFIFREKKNLWKHNIYIFFSKFFSSLKNNKINVKQKIIPLEIKLKKKEKFLCIKFNDGKEFRYPAEFLRVESPSVEVQGHSPEQKKLIAGRKYVGIIGIEEVGNYAIRIMFDDLHETGIYSWDYLYYLGMNKYSLMKHYLKKLKEKGKSRDPRKNTINFKK